MKKKYRVAYATGSRADYGIVRHYLNKLNNDQSIDFSILVTGTHLEEKFGNTIEEIIKDGYKIGFQTKLNIDNSTDSAVIKCMAIALEKFGDLFSNNKYDLLIILGDRYEMMSVAIAAAMQQIPILHLHGGEITTGNYDEFIRHCITKMSTYHFTSTPVYRDRVIQMGESPDRVYYMGALGAENCRLIDDSLVKEEIKKFPFKKYFVIAFHPETLTNEDLSSQVRIILNSIKKYLDEYQFILIGSNADTGANIIRESWMDFANENGAKYIENLNVDSYLYLVKNAIALIGNSSSGIIEAPSLNTISINIGNRQNGRVRGESVIDISCKESEILQAIQFAICNIDTEFVNPYFLPDTTKRYYEKTLDILEHNEYKPKEFFDIITNIH